MPRLRRNTTMSEVLVQSSQGNYFILQIPSCNLQKLPLPQPALLAPGRLEFTFRMVYFAPGKTLLFAMQEAETGRSRWAYATSGSTIVGSIDAASQPILSNDGTSIAWIESSAEPIGSHQVIIRALGGERSRQITLEGSARYQIMEVDLSAGLLSVIRNAEYVVLDLDGRVKERSRFPEELAVQPETYLRTDSGWIGWDAYRDEGSYLIGWMLDGIAGTHRVPAGRSINSLAINPAGTLVAVSVGSAVRIGDIADAVYVLRSRDGAEVFRRYLPRYTRTEVLFLSDELFAYSASGQTYVLRIR
jgi:hypothetical protein